MVMLFVLFSLLAQATGNRAPSQAAKGTSLIQRVNSVSRLSQELLMEVEQTPDLDHIHIVCHHHGCDEVKAKLGLVKEARNASVEALAQCGKDCITLDMAMQTVSDERIKVDAELKACSEERKVLHARVKECGRHRSKYERDLAKCATERAILERELKQCATVDRPAAEKALKECGTARQALESKLKELEKKLQDNAGSSRRRRKRKLILTEMDAATLLENSEGVESDAESNLNAQVLLVQQQIFAELSRETDIGAQLAEYDEKMEAAAAMFASNDADFNRITNGMDMEDVKLKNASTAMGWLNDRFAEASKQANKIDKKLDVVIDDTQKIVAKQAKVAATLGGQMIEEGQVRLELLALTSSHTSDEREHLETEHTHLSGLLQSMRDAVGKKEDDHEECDEMRAEVITLAGKVAVTKQKLDECLKTKSEIKKQTAQVTAALGRVNRGLQSCLRHKASLQAALDDCGKRCMKTSTMLKECLDRKKVLASKIKECHTARDLARGKLKECLAQKDELKAKIKSLEDKLKKVGLIEGSSVDEKEEMTMSSAVHSILTIMQKIDAAELSAEADAAAAGASELGVEGMESDLTELVALASEAFVETSGAVDSALKWAAEVQSDFLEVGQQLDDVGAGEEAAEAMANNAAAVAMG